MCVCVAQVFAFVLCWALEGPGFFRAPSRGLGKGAWIWKVLQKGWQWNQKRSQTGRLSKFQAETKRSLGLTWLQKKRKILPKKMPTMGRKKNGGRRTGKKVAKAGMTGGKKKRVNGKHGPKN